jgi:hypothetical protein
MLLQQCLKGGLMHAGCEFLSQQSSMCHKAAIAPVLVAQLTADLTPP